MEGCFPRHPELAVDLPTRVDTPKCAGADPSVLHAFAQSDVSYSHYVFFHFHLPMLKKPASCELFQFSNTPYQVLISGRCRESVLFADGRLMHREGEIGVGVGFVS